jgi:hypothetical protein
MRRAIFLRLGAGRGGSVAFRTSEESHLDWQLLFGHGYNDSAVAPRGTNIPRGAEDAEMNADNFRGHSLLTLNNLGWNNFFQIYGRHPVMTCRPG